MSDPDALIGRRIADRYRVDELIARGGMARVYRAHDERLARDVAVKVLSDPYASDAAFAERFLEEARTAAGLTHTNLVHVYDSGLDAGVHYIVMELLSRHRTLRARLADEGPLPVDEALDVVRQVLAGLAVVHERGFVHCDVKSGNVMVGPGPVKLIDFGIARTPAGSGRGGTSLGSLHAMPPEQLRNAPLSPASDLYAAGVVLYEALTGRVPFDADTPDGMLVAQSRPLVPPSELAEGLPRRLDDVVAQALRPVPSERFRNARAMATALDVAAASSPPAGPGDATQAVPVTRPASPRVPEAGYVPPLAMPGPPRPTVAPVPTPSKRAARGSGIGGWLVALAGLAAGGLVVWLVLSSSGAIPGGPAASASPTTGGTPTLGPGQVRVPDTIGMSEPEAEAAAQAAGLNWRLQWAESADEEPGVYDQEPPPGEIVEAGSRFVMYAWRSPD